jgi:ribose transport system permease protein
VGGNEHGAFASGLNTVRIKITGYALAGLFVGLAGIGLAVQTGSGDPTIGAPYTLNSIAATVLGGISFFGGVGQVRGTVLGALVIGLLGNLLLFTGISPFYQLVVQGVVLIVAVAVKTLVMRRTA